MDFQQLLKTVGKQREKNSGEHIFMQGDMNKSLYFVQSGLLKAYYITEEGKESIKSFVVPENIICSLTSAYSDEKCSFSLLCLEPTIIIEIPFSILYEYSLKDHQVANKMIEILLEFAMKKEKREYEFLCLSAEERFLKLMEINPTLINTVTQNDIARYLGVTPVGLSRIKKRNADVVLSVAQGN